MLDTVRLWNLAARLPGPFSGAKLHHAGLRALHARAWDAADDLLERAALAYRRELRVEPIARARVHQLIARMRGTDHRDAAACLEIERSLYRLARIERLEPPFELVDSSELLATWSAPLVADPAVPRRDAPSSTDPPAP